MYIDIKTNRRHRENEILGSSEIWNDSLKLSYNKAHRVTERTESKAISRRCRWHNEQRRDSVQIPDNSFSQNYKEEQIAQRRTVTLSHPMTQSLSADVSNKFCDNCRCLPAFVVPCLQKGFCEFCELYERETLI